MAAAMAAMMLPTALPFFVAVRRPRQIAVVVAIYAAVWAAIGVAAWLVMSHVMLPSTPYIAVIAVVLAGLYLVTPWARRGRARCQQLCREPTGEAMRGGFTYTGNCILCSAGVMAALVVIGMSSLLVMAAGSALMLLYKSDM